VKRLTPTRENDALPLRKTYGYSGTQIGGLGPVGPTERNVRSVNDRR